MLLLALLSPLAPAGEVVDAPDAKSSHEQALEITRQTRDFAHWGYEGAHGSDKWGSLDGHYRVCGGGPYQSPVALVSEGTPTHIDELHLEYEATEFHALNNGHTVQLNFEKNEDHLLLNGHSYKLIQGHFHTPSEHTLNGERFPMELHLVHLDEFDHIAVVGIPIRTGAQNKALKPIFDKLPANKGDRADHPEIELDLAHLVPDETHFFHYLGSLTTPPCTENVQWLVLETPIELSKKQISAFVKVIGENSRPVQELNRRIVTRNEANTP